MKNYFALLALITIYFLAGCKKDNKESPSSILTGKILYNKLPLNLRSSGVELELWQYGYQLRNKIPVYVSQDGSYSARLFNGSYKLTLLRGNGPWVDKTDSIDVVVKGATTADVTVDPYFIVNSFTCTRSGNTLTGIVNIQRVNTSKALEVVRFYVGQTVVTDQTNNALTMEKNASTDISQPVTFTATVPASLASKEVIFVRVGVKASGVAELLYSQPIEVAK